MRIGLAFLLKTYRDDPVTVVDVTPLAIAGWVALVVALIVFLVHLFTTPRGKQEKLPRTFWLTLTSGVGLMVLAFVVALSARMEFADDGMDSCFD